VPVIKIKEKQQLTQKNGKITSNFLSFANEEELDTDLCLFLVFDMGLFVNKARLHQ